ncbi:hypothetical protein CNBG_0254 [Cryptococcus deuterogattii R265]|uniref:uncharacterized protein n=1 Tax=Cryptococcus deuterogattii (strain R265) TaxID=294750 RepID=UPI0019388502|nr:hypothetical protein CNBG_0254 [Cryptococcus deuterogattii R265]
MAKKSHNPAEAYRKQLKAKELKKNKEARQKARETQVVKKDTRELEAEIRSLKAENNPDNKKKIQELESELKYVSKLKEKYVSEHPEEHDRIYNIRRKTDQQKEEGEGEASGSGQQLYDDRGRLRDPKRSVYYDPIYNPFGVPPPGMPYRERTADEDESDEDESDDEIVMPEGPPPDSDEEGDSDDSDDSDDIPLPEGPPPPKPQAATLSGPPLPSGPPFPPNGSGFFPLPAGYQPSHHFAYAIPPRPPPSFRPPMPPRPYAPNAAHNRPPVPVQDPLSNKPTIPYQAHKMAHALPIRPSVASGTSVSASPNPYLSPHQARRKLPRPNLLEYLEHQQKSLLLLFCVIYARKRQCSFHEASNDVKQVRAVLQVLQVE